jgi:hypothetical protein
MQVFINPGSGPVAKATQKAASQNMIHFLMDCNVVFPLNWKYIRIPNEDYGEGRFAFLMWSDNRCHEIQMPGLALHKVRFMAEEDQNIWDFPRLYVDDSSWVWKFALLGKEEED